jgi:hypothetical protein
MNQPLNYMTVRLIKVEYLAEQLRGRSPLFAGLQHLRLQRTPLDVSLLALLKEMCPQLKTFYMRASVSQTEESLYAYDVSILRYT